MSGADEDPDRVGGDTGVAMRVSERGRVTGMLGSSVSTLGRLLDLFATSVGFGVADVVRGRFPVREAYRQMVFFAGVAAVPAALVAIPFGVIISVQVGSLTSQIGASSMAGAAGALGVLRQGAPIATALLLGGAVGSAVAADLGSRTVREEIDALRTMGIDPARRVIAPRLAAVAVIAPLICVEIVFVGVATGYFVNVAFQGGAAGSYLGSFGEFAGLVDLWAALGKAEIFGLVVVAIACQRGMEARGGPRGVADAVNAAVVLSVVASFVLNLLATQLLSMFVQTKVG
ncbi:putative YrbE family protein [Gordonia polyisoprenivorans VH2]|uniref:Putative YrbE family protein n=1 Tax=Gordonia polyisoprenivorans (strain DSM 44266 / VH2) TaxID=1112204 RepID=H6MY48_GORPV|nr:ABC transporter permease [Gordonia polyisoprenivorans]AFA74275.1 putative YrbE family protein [Gordonia polyisoprenivorans VH2]